MANTSTTRLLSMIMICCAIIFFCSISAVHSSGDHHLGWIPTSRSASTCEGSIAECMGLGLEGADDPEADLEFQLDTETNRRILATTRYISYGALQRNRVPCSRRGASYYNCQPGAQANPYTRGCSAITRCRS